jgi:hypothetical protein
MIPLHPASFEAGNMAMTLAMCVICGLFYLLRAFMASSLYFDGIVPQKHPQFAQSGPHGFVQNGIIQFLCLLAFRTHEHQQGLFLMAAGTGDERIQGVDAMRKPMLQQKIQDSINRCRRETLPFISHSPDKIIGLDRTIRRQKKFQNRSA